MLVTVLMGVYNPPLGMLKEAIDSILGQTLRDFEFLIVDDGSTATEVRPFLERQAKTDPRIRILHEPHRGLTASLNRGIAEARASLIARQDADDWSAPRRLERQVACLVAQPGIALCGTNAWTHQENGRRLWRTRLPQSDLLAAFPNGNPIVHGSTMFRAAVARQLGGYCEDFRCSQDYDFFWRMTERFGAVNLEDALYHYRYTGGSISANKADQQLMAHAAIRLRAEARRDGKVLKPRDALDRARDQVGGGLTRALLKQADHLMLAGHYGDAARSYAKVLWQHPRSLAGWGKLGRLGLFCTLPGLREACFR